MRELADLTFDELLREQEGDILQALIKGQFHTGVYCAMELTLRWQRAVEERKKNDKQRNKRKSS